MHQRTPPAAEASSRFVNAAFTAEDVRAATSRDSSSAGVKRGRGPAPRSTKKKRLTSCASASSIEDSEALASRVDEGIAQPADGRAALRRLETTSLSSSVLRRDPETCR